MREKTVAVGGVGRALSNLMLNDVEGGFTVDFNDPDQPVVPVYDASERYVAAGTPLVILAGKEYGSGSSRDWAAKGTALLGVRVVIAESFERIHRSNLVNMGVLPTKGLTLPLMSYGGSGILANCAAIAILLRVDFENRQMMRGQR